MRSKLLERGKGSLTKTDSALFAGGARSAGLLVWLAFLFVAQAGWAQGQADLSLSPVALRATEMGSARGPVTIVAFVDFQCLLLRPVCVGIARHRKNLSDQVRVIVKNAPLSIHPNSPLLHEAAMAAAAQGKFWEMYDVLYARQTQKLEEPELMSIAKSLGLNVEWFGQDLKVHRYQTLVERDRLEANALGVDVTPTFFVNGKKLEGFTSMPGMKQVVDAELRRISPASVKQASVTDLRVGDINVSSAPVRGSAGASVQIVEFSDMQCPYCARQVEVLRQLVNAYPDKVAWYFKSYPLSFHPDSPLAHRALAAAGKQGKFWEMHDAVFANQKSIKRNDLIRMAAELNLDVAKFNADLEDPKTQTAVDKDQVEGERMGVSGTPAMFINGRPVTGVRTYAELQEIIEDELKIGPQGPVANSPPANVATMDLSRGPANAPVVITWFGDLVVTFRGS